MYRDYLRQRINLHQAIFLLMHKITTGVVRVGFAVITRCKQVVEAQIKMVLASVCFEYNSE